MKKNVLLLALLVSVIGFANTKKPNSNKTTISLETSRYGYMEPFKFMERGIEFYVFPNGEFDFNTHPQYRQTRRVHSTINVTYGAPKNYNHNHNNGVSISHDHLGRVRRIGNVFVNYDAFGRIKRIGSVYMNYRHHLMNSIGGLHIFYNRHHRIIRTSGYIKYNLGCHFCGRRGCNMNHYNSNNNGHNSWNGNHNESGHGWGNNDTMYYRKNNSKKRKK